MPKVKDMSEKQEYEKMTLPEIKKAQDVLKKIAQGEQFGFFMVVEKGEVAGATTAMGRAQIHGVNVPFIMETVMSMTSMDIEKLKMFIKYKELTD